MEQTAIAAAGLADAAAGPSLWALVMQADIVVKIVMLLLLVASIWCWAVIFDKGFRMMRLRRRAATFEQAFWSGAPLDELYRRIAKRPDEPMSMMFVAAMEEWRDAPKSVDPSSNGALVSRIGRVMELTLDRQLGALERNLSGLATVGSTAPFVGLFGTVWGIMNSFQAIAVTKNTTLAVVAPGIAEALFATALGLLAAIPAVIFYNRLAGELDRYAGRLASFAEEFSVVLSRELESARVS
ncbi:MAG TPA: protein TolQ [Geminicoccaceae bacterium]|nr:protein TolQ [Geminicoccaceae bacterium]